MAKDASGKKKMNGFLKFILWFFGVILFLILLIAGLLYGFFYDGSTIKYVDQNSADQNVALKDKAQYKLVDSFADTKSTGLVTFSLSQDDLNSVLLSVKDKAAKQLPSAINLTSLGVEITDTEYIFSVSVSLPLFKTRVYLHCSLNETKINDQDGYEFKINKCRLARASFLSNLALTTIKKYINNDTLNDTFKQNNLSLKADLEQNRITYTKNDLLNDILTMTANNNADVTLSQAFISSAFEYNLLKTNFYKDHSINLSIDLTTLKDNPNYTHTGKGITVDNDKLATYLTTLMDNNKFEVTDENVNTVMHYLLNGYDNSSDNAKTFVNGKDFSIIGIDNVKTYKGVNTATSVDFNAEIKNQFPSITKLVTDSKAGKKEEKIASFSEDQLTNLLLSSGLFGYSSIFYKKVDNKYNVAYMTIDNCYCDIQDNKLSIVFNLNMNGYQTSVIIDTTPSSMQNYKVNMKINKLLIGNVEIGGELKKFLYDVIDNGLKSDQDNYIAFSKADENLILNLNPAVSNSDLSKYEANCFTSKMTGANLAAIGNFEIYMNIENLIA